MRRIIFATILIFALFGITLSQDNKPATKRHLPKTGIKYSNPFFAFKVIIPPGWMVGTPATKNTHFSFYGPKVGSEQPRIDLLVTKDKQPLTEFITTFKAAFKKAYPDIEFKTDGALTMTTPKAKETYQFTATFTADGNAMKNIYTFLSNDERKYVLSFNAKETIFDSLSTAVDTSMRSLRIMKEPSLTDDQRKEFSRHYNVGVSAAQNGKFDDALKEYLEAEKIFPDYDELHMRLGMAYSLKGDLPNAQKEFERAALLDPDDYDYHFNLGTTLTKNNKYDEALKSLSRAAELDPEQEQTYTNMGVIYLLKQNNPEKAIEVLTKAVKCDPESTLAHYNLGLAYEGTGKTKEAEREFKDTLKLDTAHKGAKDGLERIKKK
ncbi:MAG: hypothetical protein A2W23_07040 [Planctomycetes bacterium RBG_16_43_13]|nr:MAG: hypothetical protein A2W23_07040 [Planctomycetes bacterium RBG_16_43_13]